MARLSVEAQKFNITIQPCTANPGETVYRVKDIWTTRDGSWDVSSKPGTLPQWARDAYLSSAFDDAGADHHLFGGVQRDGRMVSSFPIEFYTWTDNKNYTVMNAKARSGWANVVMSSGARYFPDQQQRGPWAWRPAGVKADLVVGGGMPFQWHVSWFAVWVAESNVVQPPIALPLTLEQRVAALEAWATANGWGGK